MSKSGTKWSIEELLYLKENYAKLGAHKCATTLGRTVATTRAHAWHLSITHPKRTLPEKTYRQILQEECDRHGVVFDIALGRDRRRAYVYTRFHAWARLHDMGYSFPQIGRHAQRHHTAVMDGVALVKGTQRRGRERKFKYVPPPKLTKIKPAGGIDKHLNTFTEAAE